MPNELSARTREIPSGVGDREAAARRVRKWRVSSSAIHVRVGRREASAILGFAKRASGIRLRRRGRSADWLQTGAGDPSSMKRLEASPAYVTQCIAELLDALCEAHELARQGQLDRHFAETIDSQSIFWNSSMSIATLSRLSPKRRRI